jgi:hypothetical protein
MSQITYQQFYILLAIIIGLAVLYEILSKLCPSIFEVSSFDYGRRFKYIAIIIISILFGGLFGFVTYDASAKAYELANYGISTTGEVIHSREKITRTRKGKVIKVYAHEIKYQGVTDEFNLDRLYPKGDMFRMVFSSRDKDISIVATVNLGDGYFDYFMHDGSIYKKLFVVGLFLVGLGSTIGFTILLFSSEAKLDARTRAGKYQ